MPAQTQVVIPTGTKKKRDLFSDLSRHYSLGFDETDRRRTGKGRMGSISFDEADELYRSWLDEDKWPYDALLFDPRIFTLITEKTSRLFANKLKGRLLPREGGDVLGAFINNELLDFQWEQATHGGPMLGKYALMDINTRKYGAAFALSKWHYEKRKDKILFDGPEMRVLNNRDCAHDLTATSIENCRWFQTREYVTLDDLKNINDIREKPIYKNLDKLRFAVQQDKDKNFNSNTNTGDSRASNWISRNRTISGLNTTPFGQDTVFKTIEIATEYRRDKWFTFAPKYGVILREIDNPYENNEIPIIMLRYYVIDDDFYGVSEIEPIKGPQKAINAILSQYVDEINQKLYTPVAINSNVKDHTLKWGKGARWRMNDPNRDFRLVESKSNAAAYFNNTYSALVASLLNAAGETSLGVSNIDRFQQDKTATEVQALTAQRNARDSYNQNNLGETIKRQMMLWHQMNQKMLFSDPERKNYIIRIVGNEAIKYFQQRGLSEAEALDENSAMEAANAIEQNLLVQPNEFAKPLNPVNLGSEEEPNVVPKFQFDNNARIGQLIVEPEDLKGTYDFVADVTSMSLGSDRDEKRGRAVAITALMSNPNVLQMLEISGTRPKFKELFIQWLEDSGFKDAEKFFEETQPAGQGIPGEIANQGIPQAIGNQANIPNLEGVVNQLSNPNAQQQPTGQIV